MIMYTNKKITLTARVFLLFLVVLTCVLPVFAASYPKPKDNVADDAGVLSESTIRAIQTANKTLEADTNTEISVCTVATTGDVDIADYARGVFKEWKLGEGILLLIAADDKDYYFVQSVGVENVLTNEVLEGIRDEYLEEDFEAGNIDRGVNKCVTKLKTVLTAGITAPAAEENKTETEEKGTTVGGVIAGFFKTILYIILIAVILFAAFFVFALFNDDAAAILRKYVFRRGQTYHMPEEYYDERLYGNSRNQAQRGNPNRTPDSRRLNSGNTQPRLRAPQNSQYPQRTNNYSYNADGTPRNPQRRQNPQQYPNQNRPANRQNPQNRNTNRNPNANPNRYQNNSYNNYSGDGSETRAFTIPERRN